MKQIDRMSNHMAHRQCVPACRHFWFEGSEPNRTNMIAIPSGVQDGNVLAMRNLEAETFERAMQAPPDADVIIKLGLNPKINAKSLVENEDGTFSSEGEFLTDFVPAVAEAAPAEVAEEEPEPKPKKKRASKKTAKGE